MSDTPPSGAAALSRRHPSVLLLAALSTVGPFSIDTFLPALPSLALSLNATPIQAQQIISAYLLGFAMMSLWHGAIADAVGRRPVVLTAIGVYLAGSLACTLAPSIEWLIAARFVQGLAGGVGMVLSRAIIRDCFEGISAQKMLSNVMVIFSVAPAVAPILGGMLFEWFGWRSIFGFMLVGATALWCWLWRSLPETLPVSARQTLRPLPLARSYLEVFRRRDFLLLAVALGLNFSALFLYIVASPAFLLEHLKFGPTEFGWFFIPAIGGMMVGNRIINRLIGKMPSKRIIYLGFAVMGLGVVSNVLLQWLVVPLTAPGSWRTFVSIAPIVVTACGQTFITPIVQVMLLDMFPQKRGLMSSCQGFTQVMVSACTAGVVAALVSGSPLHLAVAAAAFYLGGLALWIIYRLQRPR